MKFQSPLDLANDKLEYDKTLRPSDFHFAYTKGDLSSVKV